MTELPSASSRCYGPTDEIWLFLFPYDYGMLGISVCTSRRHNFQRKRTYVSFVTLHRRIFALSGSINGATRAMINARIPRCRTFLLLLTQNSQNVRSLRMLCANERTPTSLYGIHANVRFIFKDHRCQVLRIRPTVVNVRLPISISTMTGINFRTPILCLSKISILTRNEIYRSSIIPISMMRIRPVKRKPSRGLPHGKRFVIRRTLHFRVKIL